MTEPESIRRVGTPKVTPYRGSDTAIHVSVRLSSKPDGEWSRHFEQNITENWSAATVPRGGEAAGLHLDGAGIRFICADQEMDQHMTDLDRRIEEANAHLRDVVVPRLAEAARRAEEARTRSEQRQRSLDEQAARWAAPDE